MDQLTLYIGVAALLGLIGFIVAEVLSIFGIKIDIETIIRHIFPI
ncbi:MAG: hypothetical protein Q4A60_07805 [Pasteurellaceae bacterium]|nr:hypothetical protein [Pasteurellaceae bacterium]